MENVTPYPHKSPIQFVHLYILECVVPRIYCFLHGENTRSQVECVVNNLNRKFSDLRITLGFQHGLLRTAQYRCLNAMGQKFTPTY